MKLDIQNFKDSLLTCSEYPIITALKYYNRYDNLCFCSVIDFEYPNFLEYEGVKSDRQVRWMLECINYLYGISTEVKKIECHISTINLIKDRLNNGFPSMLFINAYWCPWLMAYRKGKKTPHYILIVGYDDNKFLCQDMMTEKIEYLPFENFHEGAKEVISFVPVKTTILAQKEKIEYLIKAIKRINGYNSINIFQNMRDFSEKMTRNFDIHKEIEGYDPFKYAPIFTWLKAVCTSYVKYCFVLKGLDDMLSSNLFSNEILELDRISIKWKRVSILLFKAITSRKADLKYISIEEISLECCNQTQDVFESILNKLNKIIIV